MSIFLRINSSLRVGGKNPISRLRNGQEIAVESPRPRETRSKAALAGPGCFACGSWAAQFHLFSSKSVFCCCTNTLPGLVQCLFFWGPAAAQAPLPQRIFHTTSQLLVYCVHLHQWIVHPSGQAPLSYSFSSRPVMYYSAKRSYLLRMP